MLNRNYVLAFILIAVGLSCSWLYHLDVSPLPFRIFISTPRFLDDIPSQFPDTVDPVQGSSNTSYNYTSTTAISPADSSDVQHIIFGATQLWQRQPWAGLLDLEHCVYKNCISRNSTKFIGVDEAAVVIFAEKFFKDFPSVPWSVRQRQYWVIMSYESSSYMFNRFSAKYNSHFNASMLYRKDSNIYYPWGKSIKRQTDLKPNINFAANKAKGAFAYLSNCGSSNYDRKALMLELKKYVDVDIYSTQCKGYGFMRSPCPRLSKGSNPDCELRFNRPYRFYLAFENSLCKDYITEKLWDRLASPGYFLPVAMGGLSIEDYTSIAPPNSFVHVSNFSSVKALGAHLKRLMQDDAAYNRYHEWRYNYSIDTSRGFGGCELCRLANERPAMPSQAHIDQWFNDPSRCRKYLIH
ncbi:alpha-(1,3)-fucosyltransferase C-like [Watersipora subatra]|uniref:alpha-(1,3)-fucosyltransferase C-like n=1 Tax=Watersipora subatra TaxID=2589382 RepID=UPI00355B1F9C